jgi:hypothetical protein
MVNTFDIDFKVKYLIINNIKPKITQIVLTMLTMIFHSGIRPGGIRQQGLPAKESQTHCLHYI